MATPSLALTRRETQRRRRPVRRANVGCGSDAAWRSALAVREREAAPHLLRHLPLVVLVTACVVVAPAALAALAIPPGGVLATVASAVLAGALSIGLARLLALLWRRRRGADLTFPELLLPGWLRRCYAERRLGRVRAAYQGAVEGNRAVRVEMLEGVARLLAVRNAYAHGHCRRVARYAERIACRLGLDRPAVAKIRTAALVHDVGKVYTPREILNKPERLTDEEYAVVKLHAADGADMLAPVRDRELAQMVRSHHERLDGSGYPDALRGDQIPLGARIIAVADTFDAITSSRPYRRARSPKEGLDVLLAERGERLDADAVDAFVAGHRATPSASLTAAVAAAGERVLALPGLLAGAVGGGFGGGTLAQLVPALGAAGLLAASGPVSKSPAFAGERVAGAGSTSLVSTLGPPAVPGGVLERGPAGGAPAPSVVRGRARGPRAGAPVRHVAHATAPVTPPGAPSPPAQGSAPEGGSTLPVPLPATELPSVPPPAPPVVTPHATPPPVTVPPVSTPPVSTPPVAAPPVSLPVTVPQVTVPTVTPPINP